MYEPSSDLSQKRKSSCDLENDQELTGIIDAQRMEIDHTVVEGSYPTPHIHEQKTTSNYI